MAEQGKELPGYVQREFEEFLQCGRLEHGFLRVRCESCHAEHLVAFSCKASRFLPELWGAADGRKCRLAG
uniref:transposase zinc-binding domain-containing protein n=1 Tax=Salmonella enterica TaxID=28901 RepID=UPI003CC9A332